MTTSYSNSKLRQYSFHAQDFGGGADITHVIACPVQGRDLANSGDSARGRVRGVLIFECTEDFVGSSSDSGVQVGDGSDPDLYFDSGLVLDETVDVGESVYLLDDNSAIDIPADADTITITLVATVGSPTGIASVQVDIEWFDI